MTSMSIYTPRAGLFPPHLAGRDHIRRLWDGALTDANSNAFNRSQSLLLTGPRGVGKTAVLTDLRRRAEAQGFETVKLDAMQGNGELLVSLQHQIRQKAAAFAGKWQKASAALGRVGSVSLGVAGFSGALDLRPANAAHASDIETVAEALSTLSRDTQAENRRGGILLLVDELQDTHPNDLVMLVWVLHALHGEGFSPVLFAGAALPQVWDRLGESASFAPRLAQRVDIPPVLSLPDAREAIVIPASQRGLQWQEEALQDVLGRSGGHPAFIQMYADAAVRNGTVSGQVALAPSLRVLRELDREIEQDFVISRLTTLTDDEVALLSVLARRGGAANLDDLLSDLQADPRKFHRILQDLIEWGDITVTDEDIVRVGVPKLFLYLKRRVDSITPRTGLEQQPGELEA